MNKRHILLANIFFAPFSYGGATVVAEQVAQALQDQGGFRITAVSLCSRNDLAPYAVIKSQKNGIVNFLINVRHERSYAEMYNNPEITARLAELISTLEPDLVHAHCVQEIGTGLLAVAEAAGIPVILSVHDFWWICERQFMIRFDEKYCGQNPVKIDKCKGCVDNFWAAKVRFNHLQETSAKAALITYPSAFARDLSEASGFAPGRGVVWQNGVKLPDDDFFAKQSKRRLADRQITFGYVGGPAAIKGWPIIKQAFSGIKTDAFRGLIVDGSLDHSWWQEKDLRALPGDWRIHPRFTQENMDEFYAEIDVLLFMSQWKETFGLAIREALARGITVVQTDSGGTVEHEGVMPADLIPIGGSPDILRRRIARLLQENQRKTQPISVTSFDDQARAFAGLVKDVFHKLEHAA
ncbi:Glycosyl transferase family protein [Sulfitobacter noctilucae]|uniref:glycosyltransferase n=1 Tax=Sulfitobacter noctilucae TaxID=1342302 RepID=UPI00046A8A05|nr:glycosyltransferase [Sulfitobacter noctilucae]KIN65799.1 Glycosyl transferase family protein [Sulfitobacter noctilucae]